MVVVMAVVAAGRPGEETDDEVTVRPGVRVHEPL